MTHFEEDYGIKTTWNFFATSHGKGVVDVIGGHVKRLVWNVRGHNYVHDEESFAPEAQKKAKTVNFLFVPEQEVEASNLKELLASRWADTAGSCTAQHPHDPHSSAHQEEHNAICYVCIL